MSGWQRPEVGMIFRYIPHWAGCLGRDNNAYQFPIEELPRVQIHSSSSTTAYDKQRWAQGLKHLNLPVEFADYFTDGRVWNVIVLDAPYAGDEIEVTEAQLWPVDVPHPLFEALKGGENSLKY